MFLRAESAARLLDLPISTFYALVRKGSLPPAASKIGKHRLWKQDDLVATADPKGYNSGHVTKIAAGHSPDRSPKRGDKVLLGTGPGHGKRGAENKATGRSTFTGILGRT